MNFFSKKINACLIGNILDHYDTSLYNFMCPFIIPLFFPLTDRIASLILAYSVGIISIISRPLGAFYFGKFAQRNGPKLALSWSLKGMAISTTLMGILPSYEQINIYASLLLVLFRFLQGFFAAGESFIASLYVLENIHPIHHRHLSSHYQISTILGILVASGLVTFLNSYSFLNDSWRLLFGLGSLTGIVGVYMRCFLKNDSFTTQFKPISKNDRKTISNKIIQIVSCSSFTYMTYILPFVFFNHYIPLINPNLSVNLVTNFSPFFLILDVIFLFLIPFFPVRNGEKSMYICALLFGITIIPIFLILEKCHFFVFLTIQIWIILIGTFFLISLQIWLSHQFKGKEKYFLIGISYSIGSEIFGRSIPLICLFLWKITNSTFISGLYCALLSFITVISLKFKK